MILMFFKRIFIFTILFPSISEGCAPTIPPEEYYPTSTLPDLEPTSGAPGAETTVAETEAPTTGGGGGTTCECNDLPPAVTQEFLDTRIKDEVDNVILPETWQPGLVSCGLSIGCFYETSDSSLESKEFFLVTAATDGGEDPITLFKDARLFCSDGTWTNNGQELIAVGCYAISK